MPVSGLVAIPQLDHSDAKLLDELLNKWAQKRHRNMLRSVYYDGKNALRDLGISIPPQLRTMETVLGWPAKAVGVLAARCNFDGFVIPGNDQDPFDLAGLFADNDMDVELPQALTSSLIHATAFLTITPGDTGAGEPDVLLLARSAKFGTGLWDRRRRSMRAALSIVDLDETGYPVELVMYQPDKVSTFTRNAPGKWVVDVRPNRTGRVWVEPLVYRPELDRPFGHSRISRAVMALTDSAIRTMVRSEVAAEFFNTPQRYLLGAEEGAFASDSERWKAVMGRFLAISRDEDGEVPEVGQFAQQSMQPHMEQLRGWASLFAGETGVPVSSLGIVQDNPSSAEAIYAAKEDLVIEASSANRVWGAALRRAASTAVMLRDGLTEPPQEMRTLQPKWRNPATPSVVSASDALVKQVSALPWLAESDVALEALGYDQATITRLRADKRRSESGPRLAALIEAGQQGEAPAGGGTEDATVLKAKFDALGVAVRAGVDPMDAARRLGLGDVAFTGAVPVSLRMPEQDAVGLEEK